VIFLLNFHHPDYVLVTDGGNMVMELFLAVKREIIVDRNK